MLVSNPRISIFVFSVRFYMSGATSHRDCSEHSLVEYWVFFGNNSRASLLYWLNFFFLFRSEPPWWSISSTMPVSTWNFSNQSKRTSCTAWLEPPRRDCVWRYERRLFLFRLFDTDTCINQWYIICISSHNLSDIAQRALQTAFNELDCNSAEACRKHVLSVVTLF